MIKCQHFNIQKEKRLINALQLVNQCRSIARAKDSCPDRDRKAFKNTLKDLSRLDINPVTIPKEWGIRHIPNLLHAYYDKVEDEKQKSSMNSFC